MQNSMLASHIRNTVITAISLIAAQMKTMCDFNCWDTEIELNDPPVYEEIDEQESVYYESFDADKLVLTYGEQRHEIHILKIESVARLLEVHECLEKELELLKKDDAVDILLG